MLARQENGSTRLYVLGLGAHALALGLLFANVLTSSSEAESPEPPPPAPAETPRETARAAPELVPAHPPRELATHERATIPAPVEDATATLAGVLQNPAAEDAAWPAAVTAHAERLERADEAALEAILADASRTVEEHIAASELLDALHVR
jgi:hypothetical protein